MNGEPGEPGTYGKVGSSDPLVHKILPDGKTLCSRGASPKRGYNGRRTMRMEAPHWDPGRPDMKALMCPKCLERLAIWLLDQKAAGVQR